MFKRVIAVAPLIAALLAPNACRPDSQHESTPRLTVAERECSNVPPISKAPDSLSRSQQCTLVSTAIRSFASPQGAASGLAPSDTLHISYATIAQWDFRELPGDIMHHYSSVEFDIPTRSYNAAIWIDPQSGTTTPHRTHKALKP